MPFFSPFIIYPVSSTGWNVGDPDNDDVDNCYGVSLEN